MRREEERRERDDEEGGREGRREGPYLSINISHLSSEDHSLHSPHHLPPGKRGPPSTGVGGACRDGPLLVHVHVNIGVRLPSETEYLQRVSM